MGEFALQINLRRHQLRAYDASKRFEVLVWHRRAGKTFFNLAMMLRRALQTNRPDYRGYYLCPTRVQAKRVAWSYLKDFTSGIPNATYNEAELRVNFGNGAQIQLLGAEQYDGLRGAYADDICLDETAQIPEAAWTQVLSPMLADRHGRATFIGTPNGRKNLFYTLYEYAASDPDWRREVLTYLDTKSIDPKEIRRQKRLMRPEEFSAEFLCSWDAAQRGAYYAKLIEAADAAQRINTVPYDNGFPVIAAVDLGWSDGMACTYWQYVGTQHRCIGADEFHATTIPEVVAAWRGKSFPIETVILPHDARVHELGTGQTRQETFHALGCKTVIAPNMSIHEGIEQFRKILTTAVFDRENTRILVEALRNYRSSYDEVRGVHSVKPVHDWSSHLADSGRYYAIGRPQSIVRGARKRGNLGITV